MYMHVIIIIYKKVTMNLKENKERHMGDWREVREKKKNVVIM